MLQVSDDVLIDRMGRYIKLIRSASWTFAKKSRLFDYYDFLGEGILVLVKCSCKSFDSEDDFGKYFKTSLFRKFEQMRKRGFFRKFEAELVSLEDIVVVDWSFINEVSFKEYVEAVEKRLKPLEKIIFLAVLNGKPVGKVWEWICKSRLANRCSFNRAWNNVKKVVRESII